MQNLDIIYEDNDIILCRKPAGVATQTKRLGQQDMESLLKNYRAKKKEPPYIGVVHRLDQPVEGLMVFAKNQNAAAGLSKQIQQKMIGKHYYAVSAHAPAQKEGMLEDYLITDKKTNVTSVVGASVGNSVSDEKNTGMSKSNAGENGLGGIPKDAKMAVLEYKVIDEKDGRTLFDIHLHTGRQHQIRVQMAHMGCPLVGDPKYGEKDKDQTVGLALCSYRLSFTHPTTGKKMDYAISPMAEIFHGLDTNLNMYRR